ncbi:MAG: hypothetical protein R3Y23_05085 [Bacillota bacterium]
MTKVIEIFRKISRTPAWLMMLFVAISYFFANAYVILWDAEIMVEELAEVMGYSSNNWVVLAMIYIFDPLISLAIFEFFFSLFYRALFAGGSVNSNKNFFMQTARTLYIISNLIIGLYSISYFWAPEFYVYGTSILDYIIEVGVVIFGFIVFSWSIINPVRLKDAFNKIFMYYFLWMGIFCALTFFNILVDTEYYGSEYVIAYSIRLGLIILSGAFVYMVLGKKITARAAKFAPPLESVTPHPSNFNMEDISDVFNFNGEKPASTDGSGKKDDEDDDEIFKGYGF